MMKLYWTDIGTRRIQRSDLDGSNVEDLVLLPPPGVARPSPESDFQEPQGLAIDPDAGKMYWINLESQSPDTEKLQRANLNGSGVEDLLVDERRGGRDIAMVLGRPHWFARYANEIRRCGLDGADRALSFDTSSRTADMSDTVRAHLSMAADEGRRMLFIAFGDAIARVTLTRAPVVLEPVTHGSASLSGTCDESDGTGVQVFVNGEPSGTPTPAIGGEWRKEHIGPLHAGDRVAARAQAPGGTWSLDSAEVVVEFAHTTTAPPATTTAAPPDSACERTVSPQAFLYSPLTVAVRCVPKAGTSSYAVDDVYPPGWAVSGISDGGVDNGTSVRWLFSDAEPREVSYTLTPPAGAARGEFSGWASTLGVSGTEITPTAGASEAWRLLATVVSGLTLTRGVAVDPVGGKLYWADGGADRIQRSNLDGSGIETLVPRGFRAVRLADGAVLAAGFATEQAADAWLAEHHPSEPSAVAEGPVNPQRIALDAAAAKMYWTESGGRYGAASGRIVRLGMDGSGVPEAVVSGLDLPQGIAIGPDTPPATTTTAPPAATTTAPPATTTTAPPAATTTAPPATTTTPPPPVTEPPVVSEPIYDGETTASGDSSEADGTVIRVFVNGEMAPGSAAVSAGRWTMTGLSLSTGDVVKATAKAADKETSGYSNEVVVLPLDAWGDPCGCEQASPCADPHTGTFQLTLAAGQGGAILPAPGTTTRQAGERIRLTAAPAAGWVFARWRFSETAHSSRRTTPPISNSTDPSAVYTAEQDAIITAEFAPAPL
jgi:hypothetical protein